MSLLIQHQIFKQDINKLNSFLRRKIKEKSKHRENNADIIDDQYEYFKSYYLKTKNTENSFIDKDLFSELISQEKFYYKNIQEKITENFLELYLPNEDFDLELDYNEKQEAFLFFYNNNNKMLREICSEFNLNTNDFSFNNIKEKKIKTNFEVQNMKLIQSNFPENKNFLLFNDIYNIYTLNIKAIHDNLQENTTKISTIDDIPICFLSDLYLDKIFTISSDDEFVKQDSSPEINNNEISTNHQMNIINENMNNSISHNKLSLIDFNTGDIISEYNLSSLNNNNIYKSGHFLNNSNMVMIYSNNMLSLIDFRSKEQKLNDLLPDYSFNFNEVILLDNFQYMTLSPHKISLFDLRYPSLPKTEKVLNINYKKLGIKKNKNKDFSYILYDKYKKDTTFIKLDLNPESLGSDKIMEDFAEFHLINNNPNSQIFIHDIVGFIHQKDEDTEESEENEHNSNDSLSMDSEEKNSINENKKENKYLNINENFFCFILDNFNGVYMNIYDINNSYNNYLNDEENIIEENDIKNYNSYDQIFELYKNYYKDLPFVSIDEEDNYFSSIYNIEKDGFESEKGFGYVKINEKDKKMYEIVSKRHIMEELAKSYKHKDKYPLVNFGFLSKKAGEALFEPNSRKVSVNSVDSDLSINELPGISKEDYENVKEIIEKFNFEKKEQNDES